MNMCPTQVHREVILSHTKAENYSFVFLMTWASQDKFQISIFSGVYARWRSLRVCDSEHWFKVCF